MSSAYKVTQFPLQRTALQQRRLDFANQVYQRRSEKLLEKTNRMNAARRDAITVVCISDTHNHQVPDVPDGDLLIHAGDLTRQGTVEELREQAKWLKSLPHPHKIVIGGNHDFSLDESFVASTSRLQQPERKAEYTGHIDWGDVIYLHDESVEIVGPNQRQLKVFGSPFTPKFGGFALQYSRDVDFWRGRIPEGVDVVVTHGPPLNHLDTNPYGSHVGCQSLLDELRRVKPRLAVFGHIHEAHGEEIAAWDEVQEAWEREVMGQGTTSDALTLLKDRVIGANEPDLQQSARLVNAAVVLKYGQEHRRPIVVQV